MSKPEAVDPRDPGQAAPLLRDTLAAGQTRVAVIGRLHAHQGIGGGPARRWHTARVPSRASRKARARLLRAVLLTTRVLQTLESLMLRVVAETCSDLRIWGWRVWT